MVKRRSLSLPGGAGQVSGIAATFIGTVVGAGFASGQEIYQFFGRYGFYGIIGIIIAVMIMGAAGAKVFYFGSLLKPKSYKDLLNFLLGPELAKIIDVFILLFFIILIAVMFAGCGTVFETTGLGYWTGIVVTGIILMITLFKELSGLISANLIIVPFMFIGCLGVSVHAIITRDTASVHALTKNVNGLKCLLAALQFSAYNIVLSFPVLLSLGDRFPLKKRLRLGSWLGSIGLGIMAGFIHWAILTHPVSSSNALPMVGLAKNVGNWAFLSYAVVLWGEMFSTLLADCYGVAKRLAAFSGWPYPIWVLILCLTGIFIARFGFVNLIAKFYPLYGYICFIVLILLFFKPTPFSGKKL